MAQSARTGCLLSTVACRQMVRNPPYLKTTAEPYRQRRAATKKTQHDNNMFTHTYINMAPRSSSTRHRRAQKLQSHTIFEPASIKQRCTDTTRWREQLSATAQQCKSPVALYSLISDTHTDRLYRRVPQIPIQNSALIQLSIAALAVHTAQSDHQEYIVHKHNRDITLQNTAASLGAQLPIHCFEQPEWEFKNWLEVQKMAARQG